MVTILDYGAGNLTSVCLAFERLHASVKLIDSADAYTGGRIVFPGVGSAATGMAGVCARGFDKLLATAVSAGTPVLGICLGMQLMLSTSEEDGGVAGLGLLPGRVVAFDARKEPTAKVPHMGWNTVHMAQHPVLAGLDQDEAFYFVHSYFAQPLQATDTLGRTDYCGEHFASIIGRGSLIATQFHPERSGAAGAKVLANFLTWEGVPSCC